LSLAMAAEMAWDDAHVWPDTRFFYDEPRFCALVSLGETIFHAAFVERGDNPHHRFTQGQQGRKDALCRTRPIGNIS
jgi:hypothetical protein